MFRKLALTAWFGLLFGCGAPESPEVVRSDGSEGSSAGDAIEESPAGGDSGSRESAPAGSGVREEGGEEELPTIVFMGTSLTAGLGLTREAHAFPGIIQEKIDSAGLEFRVVNAGVSGETSAGGLRRIDWVLRTPMDVLVLELGANDGLRGQDPEAMRENLDAIVERTKQAHPDVAIVIVGMQAPPNLGNRYSDAFRRVFQELARAHDAALVPFLLEGVGGERTLNQSDGIHPTAEGHRVLAQNVWEVLEPVLREREARQRAGANP